MAAGGEKRPQVEGHELTIEERSVFVESLVPYAYGTGQRISDDLEHYKVLAGLLGVLQVQKPEERGESFEGLLLSPEEVLHLRKMVGLEVGVAKKYGGRVKGRKHMLDAAEAEASAELAAVAEFPPNKLALPIDYRNAWSDLGTLKARLQEVELERERSAEDLMMKALRKTYEQAIAQRQQKS